LTEPKFNPEQIESFRLTGFEFDHASLKLQLNYALDDQHQFTESIVFVGGRVPTGDRLNTLYGCFSLLHALAGISYYKAAVPAKIICEQHTPDPKTAMFLEQVYLSGLAEFAYSNQLHLQQSIVFPKIEHAQSELKAPKPGLVVPIGGGKDSLVTIDLLQRSGCKFRLISVGQSALIAELTKKTGLPHICIQRQLDPHLFELNRLGAYNGHVPISAILAAVMLCGAYLYDYDTVLMSNERSANAPNLVLDNGFEVNHQYSKGLAFEQNYTELLAQVYAPGFRYFSLLRPWSELAIAKYFAENVEYDAFFSSCNRNFSLTNSANSRWCGQCPKCRFVFLAFAPFMDKARLLKIFGQNLLDDERQISHFEALLGLSGIKPFECVGEVEESRAALNALAQRSEWLSDVVVAALSPNLNPKDDLNACLQFHDEHLIPDQFLQIAHALG